MKTLEVAVKQKTNFTGRTERIFLLSYFALCCIVIVVMVLNFDNDSSHIKEHLSLRVAFLFFVANKFFFPYYELVSTLSYNERFHK